MRKADTFARRVAMGFFLVTLILAAAVSLSLWQVGRNAAVIAEVNDLRTPIVRSALSLLNGVNQSISSFRGWLLFRDSIHRESRADAWRDIDAAKSELDSLADRAMVDAQPIHSLREQLDLMRRLQDEVMGDGKVVTAAQIEKTRHSVTPLARNIRLAVEAVVADQDQKLRAGIAEVERDTQMLIWLQWLLLGIGVLAATSVGVVITRNVTSPIADAVAASTRLADEDFEFQVQLKGPQEIVVFGEALEKMRINLKAMTEGLREKNAVLQEQRWQIDGQIGLLEKMAGDQTVNELAKNVLEYLCPRFGTPMGAFYLREGDRLSASAGYAHHSSELKPTPGFALREGVVGQAAAENKTIVLEDVPSEHFRLRSGLGDSKPRGLVALPVTFDGRTSAVLELALMQPPTQAQLDFLDASGRNIGIAVNLSLSTQKTKELLEETQAQAEELQAQQEELRTANEELEVKTKSLEASEEELRTQQDQLRSTNEELEEQTALLERERDALSSRTAELEQTKRTLENRAREIEQVSRYKSEFLANMSHELRTPLNSILMLSQSLNENRTGNLSERQINALRTVHSSGSDLLTLIEDILDLSKVEAGKLDVKPERVTVSELTDTMREYFEPMAKDTKLDYHIDIDPSTPPFLTTDPARLKQILKNLLSNAFKFTNRGSVRLKAFRPSADSPFRLPRENAACVCFSVTDTGIGVPAGQIDAVFEAFKQLDAKTTRKYSGTGLGLSIVRELVHLLGGEIKMESREGAGTIVTVCLPEAWNRPSVSLETDGASAPAATEPAAAVRVPRSTALKVVVDDDRESLQPADSVILIVEDDLRFANSLLDLCRDNGFKGVILSDGVSAVKLAEEILPHGILLDLSLPELDGSDVIRLLKENPRTRHIPIQVITGHDRKREVLSEGAIGFIRKPAKSEDLKEVLHRIRDYSGGEKRLLIVEDDEAQRRAIREFIEVPGVSALEAESGARGLELLKGGAIGCIILDLKLPDMEGREFLRLAKEACGEELPPVIIYTGRDLDDAELKMLEREAKSIIVKSAKSPERLFDETMMFLHRLQKDLPAEKRRIVENLHDPTRILRGKSVLVVDDDPRNILSLTHLLEDHGVVVHEAENGRAALDWLARGAHVDLVLMDMMMPEMDGYEATRKIRETPKFKGLPIVALTARAMRGERERCLEAGCDDYLSKPIENDKLISLLRVWLYRSA